MNVMQAPPGHHTRPTKEVCEIHEYLLVDRLEIAFFSSSILPYWDLILILEDIIRPNDHNAAENKLLVMICKFSNKLISKDNFTAINFTTSLHDLNSFIHYTMSK